MISQPLQLSPPISALPSFLEAFLSTLNLLNDNMLLPPLFLSCGIAQKSVSSSSYPYLVVGACQIILLLAGSFSE